MKTIIICSLFYFAISLVLLFEISKFTNNLCWSNIINISKFIFFQFVITSYFLLFVGDDPTFYQALFMTICFFCALFYIIFDCLKSGDIASFIMSLLMIFVMAYIVLLICLQVISKHNISNMFKAFIIFLTFALFFLSLAYTKIVIKYKLVYSCYVLILCFIGFILLFTAFKFPEDASYKSIHNTISSWGKITDYKSPEDVIQILQASLLVIGFAYIRHISKFIKDKSASKLEDISQNQ